MRELLKEWWFVAAVADMRKFNGDGKESTLLFGNQWALVPPPPPVY